MKTADVPSLAFSPPPPSSISPPQPLVPHRRGCFVGWQPGRDGALRTGRSAWTKTRLWPVAAIGAEPRIALIQGRLVLGGGSARLNVAVRLGSASTDGAPPPRL